MTTSLKKIDFGNEAGDDVEFPQLSTYFYEQASFQRFVSPNEKLAIATAKKGVGKSALLRWAGGRLKTLHPDDIVIRCRGADLARGRFGIKTEKSLLPNERIRDWMVRICALANRELATRIGLALSDDKITLIESAELDGFKERNLIGCLLDRLGRMLPSSGPDKKRIQDEVEIFKRVKSRRFWLLVDDLDATFQNTEDELLEMSTCFSALRYLVQDIEGMYFRATLRTDVWPLIRRYDESLDKVEQYVREVEWSRDDFRGLLSKRIESQVEALQLPPPPPGITDAASDGKYEKYFIDLVIEPEMEWAQKIVPNYQVIYTLSYQRPRWGIQLCKLAQAHAIDRKDEIIRKSHIDDVWGEYGTKRIADLVAEHKHQCGNIEDLVFAFRGANRLMSRDELFDWINRHVITHVHPLIEGTLPDSPKPISRFLYRIGFLVARSDNPKGFEHYSFDQMPDLLASQTNEDFNLGWEIHPCYRQALDIQKVDRSHRARFGRMRSGKPLE